MNVYARRAAVGIAAAATVTLAACSSGTTTSSGASTTPASTSVTASSGSAATSSGMSMSSGAMSSAGMDQTHNDADVTFAQMMIVHHQSAIEMADLAPTRAASQQVKDLAVKIKAAQTPEINQMTGWLQAWGAGSGTDMNGMPNTSTSAGMGGMPGMEMGGSNTTTSSSPSMGMQMPGSMTAEQMSQLTAATGANFDKMFLQMMITHHQGAVQMADTEIAEGLNPDALALAQSIKSSQTEEIATMQQLLQTL